MPIYTGRRGRIFGHARGDDRWAEDSSVAKGQPALGGFAKVARFQAHIGDGIIQVLGVVGVNGYTAPTSPAKGDSWINAQGSVVVFDINESSPSVSVNNVYAPYLGWHAVSVNATTKETCEYFYTGIGSYSGWIRTNCYNGTTGAVTSGTPSPPPPPPPPPPSVPNMRLTGGTFSAASFVAGTTGTYTFALGNNGSASATNATLSMAAPSGVTINSIAITNTGSALPTAPTPAQLLAGFSINQFDTTDSASVVVSFTANTAGTAVFAPTLSNILPGDTSSGDNSLSNSVSITAASSGATIGQWRMRVPATGEGRSELIGAQGQGFNDAPYMNPALRDLRIAVYDTWNQGVDISATKFVYGMAGHSDGLINGLLGIEYIGANRIPKHYWHLVPLTDQQDHTSASDTNIWNAGTDVTTWRTVACHSYRTRRKLNGRMLEYTHRATARQSNQVKGVAAFNTANTGYEAPATCPDVNTSGLTLGARSPVWGRQDETKVFIYLGSAIFERSAHDGTESLNYHHFSVSTAIDHCLHRDSNSTHYGIDFAASVFQSWPSNLAAGQRGSVNNTNAATAPTPIPVTGDTTAFTTDFRVSSSVMISEDLGGIVCFDGYSGKVGLLTWAGNFSIIATTGSAYSAPSAGQRGTIVDGVRPPVFTNTSAEYGMYDSARLYDDGSQLFLTVAQAPEQLGCEFDVRLQ